MMRRVNYKRTLLITVFVFIIVVSTLNVMWELIVLRVHGSYDNDLKVFSESLETTINGEGLFFNEIEWKAHGAWNHFGTHNSPILFLLLPVYAIWQEPLLLNVLQILFVGFGALPLFKLAREVLKDERKAFIISISYLLNPITHGIVRHDFHPCVLGVPFMFLFAYYVAKNETKRALIAALLVLSVKEDAGLFLIAYAMFEVLRKHGFRIELWFKERQAVMWALLGTAWFLISIFIVIPHFNVAHKYPYFALYEGDKSKTFAFASLKLAVFMISLALLPLRDFAYFAPIAALWLENALANRPLQGAIGWQHDYMMLPMGFIVLVYALKERDFNLKALIRLNFILMLLFSPFSPLSKLLFDKFVYNALWWLY
ncbi:MAG: DUF2079 domain-containing protein [Thermococcus sp.]|uniref:DUF2079 domain-containing protein n=1 Tax=Thermococcus sp. TaxID=35749 RepID=UPI001E069450|nr:DUF2079 domain-containing protein [Thermococcus sp.]MBO8175805.1 DUF2079 domain-containing protein [Thermococcus sp.]